MVAGIQSHPLNRQFLQVRKHALNGILVLVAGISLTGIGFLYLIYFQQNAQAGQVFQQVAVQANVEGTLTPADLVDLSHQMCVLDSDISNIQSFLQPMAATLTQGGWCGNYVRIFVRFAGAAGYPAHKLHIQSRGRSHTLAEVYYDDEWRVIDPFFNLVYLKPDGDMATFEDLRDRPELLAMPVQRPMIDPDLYRIYGRYEPILPDLYRDAPDFYPALSRGAFYHNAFVMVSYPLDPFYDGERRPFLPPWLDRPELLGVYGLSGLFLLTAGPVAFRQIRTWKASSRN